MKTTSRTSLFLALSAILAAPTTPLEAAPDSVYWVTNPQDSGAGSLRAAIASANASVGLPDTIQFDPVLSGGTILLQSSLTVTDTLTIDGPNGGITIRRDASQPPFRLITADDGTPAKRPLRLEQLVLEGGYAHATGSGSVATARGGAVYSREGLDLVACVVTGNQAVAETNANHAYAYGGAIAVTGAPLYMVLSAIEGNATIATVEPGIGTALAQGPVWVQNQSSQPTVIADSIITGNNTTATAAVNDARASGTNIFGTLSLGNGTDIYDNFVYALAPDYALAAGGGVASQTSFQNYSTNFSHCSIRDNTVAAKATAGDARAEGGGLLLAHLAGGSSSIQRCTITGNDVKALAIHNIDDLQLTAPVTASAEGFGGGLWLGIDNGGHVTVQDSTISTNKVDAYAVADHTEQQYGLDVESMATAVAHAGAVFSTTTPGGSLLLLNSTVSGNRQEANADSYAGSTQEVVSTSTSNAEASGGLYMISGGTIANSTIVDNHSNASGSAIAVSMFGGPENESINHQAGASGLRALNGNSTQLYSSLIAQNTASAPFGTSFAPDLQGTFLVAENNLLSNASGSNIVNGVDGNIVTPVVQVAPLADNGGPTLTHALLPGATAIDAGSNPYYLFHDQRGYLTREVNGVADIGAFEFGAEAFQSDQVFANGFE